MRDSNEQRSVGAAKAGRLYGTFTPSIVGSVQVKKSNGIVYQQTLTRKQRRFLARRPHNERES